MESFRYSCQMSMKLVFFRQIFKKYSQSNGMKIRPEGAQLLRADGQTDGELGITKLTVASRSFFRMHLKITRRQHFTIQYFGL